MIVAKFNQDGWTRRKCWRETCENAKVFPGCGGVGIAAGVQGWEAWWLRSERGYSGQMGKRRGYLRWCEASWNETTKSAVITVPCIQMVTPTNTNHTEHTREHPPIPLSYAAGTFHATFPLSLCIHYLPRPVEFLFLTLLIFLHCLIVIYAYLKQKRKQIY